MWSVVYTLCGYCLVNGNFSKKRKTLQKPLNTVSPETLTLNVCLLPKWPLATELSVPQLGCVQSLLPLHTAVSTARLTSCLGIDSRGSRSLSQGMLSSANPGV
ncbi:hypothetical protein Pint_12853 [Pistacia integerrima]|uniref:Uncharacterized protein n=1 Tax=Pistacia integerrima TaxID=434235 RepID=A0ACC0YC83_9ROSI|nr:hypothetical protein Pint_12853 [Pistacia integerrima]